MNKIIKFLKWITPRWVDFKNMSPAERLGLISTYIGFLSLLAPVYYAGEAIYERLQKNKYTITGTWDEPKAYEIVNDVMRKHYLTHGIRGFSDAEMYDFDISPMQSKSITYGSTSNRIFLVETIRESLNKIGIDSTISIIIFRNFINNNDEEWRIIRQLFDLEINKDDNSESIYELTRLGNGILGIKKMFSHNTEDYSYIKTTYKIIRNDIFLDILTHYDMFHSYKENFEYMANVRFLPSVEPYDNIQYESFVTGGSVLSKALYEVRTLLKFNGMSYQSIDPKHCLNLEICEDFLSEYME